MLTKVQKWGNSQGLRFSKAILEEAAIHVGDEVRISVEEGRIIVEPAYQVRGRFDIEKLVAEMPADYHVEEADWGEPTGEEIW
ncbi:MAG: transcriptional regulator/antitoxin, MazE [Anaerolineae bacterium]|nr:transcriptional regulator/antitoxin, MazE [Anaerolineae bacterium]